MGSKYDLAEPERRSREFVNHQYPLEEYLGEERRLDAADGAAVGRLYDPGERQRDPDATAAQRVWDRPFHLQLAASAVLRGEYVFPEHYRLPHAPPDHDGRFAQ